MTEDEVSDAEKRIQEVTDKFIKMIDTITATKDTEIMAI